MPNGVNEANPSYLGNPIYGNTNFLLQVLNATGTQPRFSLYMVDSNSYSTQPGVGGYGWVHLDQIAYFMNQSAAIKAAAAAGGYAVPNALAYQHIPLPEHDAARSLPIIGQYHEAVCAPSINTGLFAAYLQSGDVKAVTVGHDHTSEWLRVESHVGGCPLTGLNPPTSPPLPTSLRRLLLCPRLRRRPCAVLRRPR